MFWKPLLIVVPAGLVLGSIGGHWARPVMTQRAGDSAAQSMFQTRADRYGRSGAYPKQAEGPVPYDGGYSYAPDWAVQAASTWTPPDYDHYADAPLPTLAQLDAHQAALLADPEVQFRSAAPGQPDGDQPQAQDLSGTTGGEAPPASAQVALGPEPRTDGGALPPIW
jgi:hypothetical protein